VFICTGTLEWPSDLGKCTEDQVGGQGTLVVSILVGDLQGGLIGELHRSLKTEFGSKFKVQVSNEEKKEPKFLQNSDIILYPQGIRYININKHDILDLIQEWKSSSILNSKFQIEGLPAYTAF
jgi:hypothetical protein